MATRTETPDREAFLTELRRAFIAVSEEGGRDFSAQPCKPLLLYADNLYRRRKWWRAARDAVGAALLETVLVAHDTGDVEGAVEGTIAKRVPWQVVAMLDDPTVMLDVDGVDILALSRFAEALPGWDEAHCPFGLVPLDPETTGAGPWPADARERLRAIDYEGR
jgi:hypothetical protein